MICFPNAKINLGLHVYGKRDDGYHTIETVFYPVPFTDILEVIESKSSAAAQGQIEFYSMGLDIEGDANANLVVRAYRELHNEIGLPSVKCYLYKSIPMGAGLGGGSADAAFMIRLLNDKFSLGLTVEQMKAYAGRIGSDCAFFIDNKPTYVLGRGTELEHCDLSLSGRHIIILDPRKPSGTTAAYEGVKKRSTQVGGSLKDLLKQPVTTRRSGVVNDFEQTVFTSIPEVAGLKEKLYECGATYASMTGSGSAVYGLFDKAPVLPPGLLLFHTYTGVLG